MMVNPDFYFQLPEKLMLDKRYTRQIAQHILNRLTSLDQDVYTLPTISGDTTHFSAADVDGNARGITQSIELVFGSKTIAKGLVFYYNN